MIEALAFYLLYAVATAILLVYLFRIWRWANRKIDGWFDREDSMKKLLLVALVLFAAQAYALPPVVPAHFSGMAEVALGADRSCRGDAPFMFEVDNSGFRVLLTTPPCFRRALKLSELIQIQPTSLGTLWLITLRADDPGHDDGPMLHLLPANPADQEAMAWGPNEVSRHRVTGRRLDSIHYELRFVPLP